MYNLESFSKTDRILIHKNYIEQILDQLLIDYQKTQEERIKIAKWEEKEEFSILGIIEMLTDTIRGYGFQVINNHSLNNSTEIINELEKLKIFEIPELTDWYFSAKFHYPKSKNYLETLDYLRLLILEHIRDFKLM